MFKSSSKLLIYNPIKIDISKCIFLPALIITTVRNTVRNTVKNTVKKPCDVFQLGLTVRIPITKLAHAKKAENKYI